MNNIDGGKIDKDSANNKAKDNKQKDDDVEICELQKGILEKDDSQNKEEDLLNKEVGISLFNPKLSSISSDETKSTKEIKSLRKNSSSLNDSSDFDGINSDNSDDILDFEGISKIITYSSSDLIDRIYRKIESSMQTFIKPRKSTKINSKDESSINNESVLRSDFLKITKFKKYHQKDKQTGENKRCFEVIFGKYSQRENKTIVNIKACINNKLKEGLSDGNKVYEQIVRLVCSEETEDVEKYHIKKIAYFLQSNFNQFLNNVANFRFDRVYYTLLCMKFLQYNDCQLEILRLIDPYIPVKVLVKILKPEVVNIFKDSKGCLSKICNIYNTIVNDTITEIISKIKELSKRNKINLQDEFRANAKIMIKKTELAYVHKKETELMTKERERFRKESETILYCKSDKHIEIQNDILSCILYDPNKYNLKIEEEDMNEIYEYLEKAYLNCNTQNNKTSTNSNYEKKTSQKKFLIDSLKIDYNMNYADKPNEPYKILKKKRIDIYLEEVKESAIINNNIWYEEIEKGAVKAFECKIERNSIVNFPWGIKSRTEEIYSEMLEEKNVEELIKWNEFEGVTNQTIDRNLQITCERLYGSFPFELIKMVIGETEVKLACLKLLERSKTIAYLVKHGLFKDIEMIDYKQKILSFITKIFKSEEMTESGELLVGSQTGEMYTEKMIMDFPFEAIMRVKSTLGRLKVLYHSDELSSLPDLSKLESMKRIIGVSHKSEISNNDNLT